MKKQHIVIGSVVVVVVVAVGLFFVFRGSPQANKVPTGSFRATPSESKPRTIEFDATGSDDPDGKVTDYAWDFGDGRDGRGATVEHTYDAAGEYTVELTVTDDLGALSEPKSEPVVTHSRPVPHRWESVQNPATAIPPMFADIEPADGAVVRGTESWVRWSPSSEAEGRVLWHKVGEAAVRITDATGDGRLTARLQPLEVGEKYEYVVEQISGDFVQRSRLRAFSVEGGVVFDPPVVEKTIQRDYDQTVIMTLRNNTEDPIKVSAKALKHFDDLPAEVVGRGSVDDPVEELEPGEPIDLRLAVFAQDATRDTYEIPVEAAGVVGTVRVRIAKPKFDLDIRIVGEPNPRTLAKTIKIINNGSTLTDLAVRIAQPNEHKVRLEPAVNHGYLIGGASKTFVASPILFLEFESLEVQLQCTAAGQMKTIPLTFTAPEGKRLIAVRSRTSKSSVGGNQRCTNSGQQCDELPGTPDTGPVPPADTAGTAAASIDNPTGNLRYASLWLMPSITLISMDRLTAQFASTGGRLQASTHVLESVLVAQATIDSPQPSNSSDANGDKDSNGGSGSLPKDPGYVPFGSDGCISEKCLDCVTRAAELIRKKQALYVALNIAIERDRREKADGRTTLEASRTLGLIGDLRNLDLVITNLWKQLMKECEDCGIGNMPYAEYMSEEYEIPPVGFHTAPGIGLSGEGKDYLRQRGEEITKEAKEDMRDCSRADQLIGYIPVYGKHRKHLCEEFAWLKEDIGQLYEDLANDPPSIDFERVVTPRYEPIVPRDQELGPAVLGQKAKDFERTGWLAVEAQRWTVAYLKAYLDSLERFQGAHAAGNSEAKHRQALAMIRFADLALAASREASQKNFEYELHDQEQLKRALSMVSIDDNLEEVLQIKQWLANRNGRLEATTIVRGLLRADESKISWPESPFAFDFTALRLFAVRLLQRETEGANSQGFSAIHLGHREALIRRARFTRAHRGSFASPNSGDTTDSSDFSAAWYTGDRVCFAWHHDGANIIATAFDVKGETIIAPEVLGRGRWPHIVARGNQTAVAWQSEGGITVRVYDGEEWSGEITLSGSEAAIAFVPDGPLCAATSTGLWMLGDGQFEQIQQAPYSQPAITFDKEGNPHVAWQRDGRIVYQGEDVAEGERPSILVAPDGAVYLAYLSNGELIVRSLQGGGWTEPQTIPAVNPAWPALALGERNEVRLTYLGDAEYGPPALWLVRLPDTTPILVPSLEGNVTDAWLTIEFELKDPRDRYRSHNMLVTVNDVLVELFEDTVPEGRYRFQLDPQKIFYSTNKPAPNRIAVYSWDMNSGNYLLSTGYQLTTRSAWSEFYGFADSSEQLIKAAGETWKINHDQPDLVLLANNLDLPVKAPVDSVDFAITVANLGEADAPATRLVMVSEGETLAIAEIPMLRLDEEFVTTFRLDRELESVRFRLETVENDFDPENDELSLMLWAKYAVDDGLEPSGERADDGVRIIAMPIDVQPAWVAESLPDGARAIGDWPWSEYLQFGQVRVRDSADEGQAQHYFIDADDQLALSADDNLIQYVYLDPEDPPLQILLQLYSEGGRVAQQVYWGADLIQLPGVARVRAGPLPETGTWVRLRIPVETLEMDELWLSGLLYAQYGGRVVWGPTTKSLDRLDRTPELLLVTEEGRPR